MLAPDLISALCSENVPAANAIAGSDAMHNAASSFMFFSLVGSVRSDVSCDSGGRDAIGTRPPMLLSYEGLARFEF